MRRSCLQVDIQGGQFSNDGGQAPDWKGGGTGFCHGGLDPTTNAEIEVCCGQGQILIFGFDQDIAQDRHCRLRTDDIEDLGQTVAEVVPVDFEFHALASKEDFVVTDKSYEELVLNR